MRDDTRGDSVRYVAIGDSFTEGVGDELPDGSVRGWADLVAKGWADGTGRPIEYANLAIRGKLIWPIVDEQLERALALRPTHGSFNGGGNDMLRPRLGRQPDLDQTDWFGPIKGTDKNQLPTGVTRQRRTLDGE